MADTKVASKEIIDEVVTPEVINDDVVTSSSDSLELIGDHIVANASTIISSFSHDINQQFFYPDKKKDGSDNKLKGQSYWIISYNGKSFTTRDKQLVEALSKNDVYEIRLKRNGEYLEIVAWSSISGRRNQLVMLNEIKALEAESIEREVLSRRRISYINSLDLQNLKPDESLVKSLMAAV